MGIALKFPFQNKGKSRVWFWGVVWLFFLCFQANVAQSTDAAPQPPVVTPPGVLVLHSHRAGSAWTDNVTRGIGRVFESRAPDAELFFEYLDVRPMETDDYPGLLKQLLHQKYSRRALDLVIAVDDGALDFLLNTGGDLFSNLPFVFCGVSRYDPEIPKKSKLMLTGVLQIPGIRATLDLARKLHPDTRKIVCITDKTPAGRDVKQAAKAAFAKQETRLEITFLEYRDTDRLKKEVADLSPGTIVLALFFSKDAGGGAGGRPYHLKSLAAACPVPIYSVWASYLGGGIVGGMLTGGEAQGIKAGEMAKRILGGEPAASIPVVRGGVGRYMFDYNQMARFHIKESSLPQQSIVINGPTSLFQTRRFRILCIGAFILVSAGLMAILFVIVLQRKRLETALGESEKRFSLFMDHLPAMVFMKDAQSRTIYINFHMSDVFGVKNWLGKTAMEIFPKSAAEKMTADDKKTLANGYLRTVETIADKNGVAHTYETYKFRIDRRGDTPLLGGIAIEITEREQARQEREKLQAQLVNALEMAHLGHWEYDVLKDMFTFNDHFYKVFRTTAREVGGYTMSSAEYARRFIHPDDVHVVADETKKAISATNPDFARRLEHRMLYADGSVGYISVRFFIIKDDFGRTIKTYGVNQDITERKKMEEHIWQIQKMESIGNMAGGIAHDFNNILFPIVSLSEMLLEDLPHGSFEHENAREIFKAGKRGSDLVKQILAFSRQAEHKKIPIRLQNVLKEALKLSRSTIPANIRINQEIQTDCGLAMADPTQIHQIVMNLVNNAYHAVESTGGEIRVGLKQVMLGADDFIPGSLGPGPYAVLTVSDTGCGIDVAMKDKIFEPYFTTKKLGKGTGLGLAVVYGIVKKHHGDIKVHSRPGKGAAFHVYLPLMEKSVEPKEAESAGKYPTGHEHILLVDDEEPIVRLETKMLQRLGYGVTPRTGSPEALEAFYQNPDEFHLVITDMTMPFMTGDVLAKKLLAIRPDIPIIICTGFSERLSQDMIAALGIKGLLMKPIVKSEMAGMVRKVLDETGALKKE